MPSTAIKPSSAVGPGGIRKWADCYIVKVITIDNDDAATSHTHFNSDGRVTIEVRPTPHTDGQDAMRVEQQ